MQGHWHGSETRNLPIPPSSDSVSSAVAAVTLAVIVLRAGTSRGRARPAHRGATEHENREDMENLRALPWTLAPHPCQES